MNKIWAPWRSKFIYSRKKTKCIFRISKKPSQDKKRYIIERSKHSFSMLNLYPYNNGHIMIAPYRHVKSPELLNDKELLDIKANRRLHPDENYIDRLDSLGKIHRSNCPDTTKNKKIAELYNLNLQVGK